MRAEISDYKQKNESNPPRIISLSKWRGKEVWHPWPVQTTSERQRRQMNCLWQCWAPLGSYKWLSMHLPLVVCVCMVFNECFTYQDSSITNEGRTVFCYCSHKPDTKLWTLKIAQRRHKKRPGFSTMCAGLIMGDAFFREKQQSIVRKCATYSQKTFCQFDALCVFHHTAAENMNIDKMTQRCIIKTLFITELPPVCPHSLKVNSSTCEFKQLSMARNDMSSVIFRSCLWPPAYDTLSDHQKKLAWCVNTHAGTLFRLIVCLSNEERRCITDTFKFTTHKIIVLIYQLCFQKQTFIYLTGTWLDFRLDHYLMTIYHSNFRV